MKQYLKIFLFLICWLLNFPAQALSQDDILPANQAFKLSSRVENGNIILNWQIAEGYYLYRDKFKLSVVDQQVNIEPPLYPKGKLKSDPYFGEVEIYRQAVNILLTPNGQPAQDFILKLKFQGCADVGVCYPPQTKRLSFQAADFKTFPITQTSIQNTPIADLAEQDQIAWALKNDTLGWTALSFLGFGLLLAFSPCCLPMIPILSGIIIGHGKEINTSKAFILSLTYVISSALTYTIFGIFAGLFGSNLQAIFQNPWIIGSFSAIFVILALSMFGFFQLQLPASLQARFASISNQQQSGSFIGVAIMGALSALIVGPCVAAPLAGALIYIGQSGDALLGGIALFMMGFGMGVPLLLIGSSAGKWLPKAGTWMDSVKVVFGVMLLAVAVWLLSRILPEAITLILWALLLIIPAIYMGAVDALPEQAGGWYKMRKGLGVVSLLYGGSLFIGVLSGSTDALQPLKGFSGNAQAIENKHALNFIRVASNNQLDEQIKVATDQQQWLMLDFYADWCSSCVEMEKRTFTDPSVQKTLSNMRLVQADVTDNELDHVSLLKRFGLIGPPAILFISPDGQEQRAMRSIGFKNSDEFLQHLRKLHKNSNPTI